MTLKFNPNYSIWRQAFENEKIFTRSDMVRVLGDQRRELERSSIILGVLKLLPNDNQHMMQIHRVDRGIEGIYIVVR